LHVTSEEKVLFGFDGPGLDMALYTVAYMRIIFVCKAAQSCFIANEY
jgi:hypothetical protein